MQATEQLQLLSLQVSYSSADVWEQWRRQVHSLSGFFVCWYSWIVSVCQSECRLTSSRGCAVFSDDVLSLLVAEANRFAAQFLFTSTQKRKARAHSWHATDEAELKKFLGLLLLMGIVKKPRVEDFWNSDPAIATPAFNTLWFGTGSNFYYNSDISAIMTNKLKETDFSNCATFVITYYKRRSPENVNTLVCLWEWMKNIITTFNCFYALIDAKH